MQSRLFSSILLSLSLIITVSAFAHAAPANQDLGKEVSNTIEKAGDNLDKSMKSFDNGVKKQVSKTMAATNAKTKAGEKNDAKGKTPKDSYSVQQAEKELNQVGKNLDNSMKTASQNVRKGLAQPPTSAKK